MDMTPHILPPYIAPGIYAPDANMPPYWGQGLGSVIARLVNAGVEFVEGEGGIGKAFLDEGNAIRVGDGGVVECGARGEVADIAQGVIPAIIVIGDSLCGVANYFVRGLCLIPFEAAILAPRLFGGMQNGEFVRGRGVGGGGNCRLAESDHRRDEEEDADQHQGAEEDAADQAGSAVGCIGS